MVRRLVFVFVNCSLLISCSGNRGSTSGTPDTSGSLDDSRSSGVVAGLPGFVQSSREELRGVPSLVAQASSQSGPAGDQGELREVPYSVAQASSQGSPAGDPALVPESEIGKGGFLPGEDLPEPWALIGREWVELSKNAFQKSGAVSSPIFDWYLEGLSNQAVTAAVGLYGEKDSRISSKETEEEKERFVFSQLSIAHWHQISNIDEKGGYFLQEINGEKVLFLSSFTPRFMIEVQEEIKKRPDRVAILRSYKNFTSIVEDIQSVEPSKEALNKEEIRKQGIKALTDPMVQVIEYIHKNEIPVHIFGKCDALCASYLVPHSKKVHIEPFGEVLFNEYSEEISHAAQLFMKQRRRFLDFNNEEFETLSDYAKYLQAHFNALIQEKFFKQVQDNPVGGRILVNKIKAVIGEGKSFHDVPLSVLESLLATLSQEETQFLNWFSIEKFENVSSKKEEELLKNLEFVQAQGLTEEEEKMIKKLKEKTALRTAVNFQMFVSMLDQELASLPIGNGERNNSLIIGLFTVVDLLVQPDPFIKAFKFPVGDDLHSLIQRNREGQSFYSAVSPETSVLRRSGFNVTGLNSGYRDYHLQYINWDDNPDERPLPIYVLREEVLDNCRFFNGEAFSKTQFLTRCTAEVE